MAFVSGFSFLGIGCIFGDVLLRPVSAEICGSVYARSVLLRAMTKIFMRKRESSEKNVNSMVEQGGQSQINETERINHKWYN